MSENKYLRIWREMSEEERVEHMRKVIDYFYNIAKRDRMEAWIKFNRWLASEEGAVIFPHFWKPEYRDYMICIAYNGIMIAGKVLSMIMGNG